jgi:AmmeMemoRadiSam system protein B/AmmeMemoRadiSam system protein A
MQTVLVVLLSIFTIMETFAQNNTTDRQPVAAGRFYPADKDTLTRDLSQLFEKCKKSPSILNVRAILSPHAGYTFSGKTAAFAYSSIPKNAVYKNIFIIGSSHIMYFDGASVYNSGDYITPLGRISVNKEIANKLIISNKVFGFPTTAHGQEHSIEVQLPFIQYYFKNPVTIIPIIIGSDNVNTVKKIAEALRPWFTPENLFVISSDFSHYPSYKNAVETDRLTAESILTGSPEKFLSTLSNNGSKNIHGLVTSMCGWTSGLTLLYLAEGNKNLEMKLLDYSNSGDSPNAGKDEVVGYNAIAMYEKKGDAAMVPQTHESFSFTEVEKEQLFTIVKSRIRSRLYGEKTNNFDERSISSNLKKPMGAFVTLKINGALRGCIGNFNMTGSPEPLYNVVAESAISSAFEDPRFSPLTKEEYKNTDIEITVLGPLKKISNINEIVLGKHGIYIKKGPRAGTMLPQVATENGWTVEQFLGYTSRDKAGIGWDGWKDAEIFIYEGVVLEETK